LIEVLELGVMDTVKLVTASKLSSYFSTCPGNSLSELGTHFDGTSSLKPSYDFDMKPVSVFGVPKMFAAIIIIIIIRKQSKIVDRKYAKKCNKPIIALVITIRRVTLPSSSSEKSRAKSLIGKKKK
jgi:hypothetical protein